MYVCVCIQSGGWQSGSESKAAQQKLNLHLIVCTRWANDAHIQCTAHVHALRLEVQHVSCQKQIRLCAWLSILLAHQHETTG